jgi:hypothetical protein
MAFIPVLNCVQARLIWIEDNGVVAQNVFYHATPSVPTATELEDIGTVWGEMMTEAGIGPDTTMNWALSEVALRAMNEDEGISMHFTDGMPISGTNTQPQLPDNVAYTVTWNTGLVGRSARGRTYGIGLPTNFVENRNQLTSAGQSALQNQWGVVMDGFISAGHALQVVSFQEGGVPRSTGRKLPILAHQVRFPLATQRRRLS